LACLALTGQCGHYRRNREVGANPRQGRGEAQMSLPIRLIAAAAGLFFATAIADPAGAQKPGGILKVYFFDSPASMSIHEESTIAGEGPAMGVFNNLVMYDQQAPQSGMNSIVPDLATEWSWDEEHTKLTFKLRHGVKWHDGKPFTAKDVKCTFDLLLGTAGEKLRLNPRKPWYRNLDAVVPDGDDEVSFQLKRPQPAFIALLASGFTPIYPCHVAARDMRQHPIGTGPFKFVEFKPNEYVKVCPPFRDVALSAI
jgi:peptide/nickel transport system substrate-binding protein